LRKHRIWLLIAALLALYLVGGAVLSRSRLIDGDEGYYAAAARLTAEGRSVYTDFFYPQMPYLPTIYALAGRLTGYGILSLRLVSVLAAGLGLLFWAWLLARRAAARPWLLAAGVLLTALNPHLLSWNVTVKTYALTTLGVLAAWWCLERALDRRRAAWWLAAGAACGFVVGVRGLFAPWAAAVVGGAAVAAGRRHGARAGLLAGALLAAGLLAALAPALIRFAGDPDRFVFDNLTYHRLRYDPFVAEPVWRRWLAALAEAGRALFLQPALLLTVVLAAVGAGSLCRRRDDPWRGLGAVAGWSSLVYVVTSLLPDPVYEQYFTGVLPALAAPLVFLGLEAAARGAEAAGRPGGYPAVPVAAVVLAGVLAANGVLQRHVGEIRRAYWRPDDVERVARRIRDLTVPEDVVLSFWSGYANEADRRFVPGMENHFALGVSEKLTLDQQLHYHVAGKELLLLMFTRRTPAAVVLGAWNHEIDSAIPQKDLMLLLSEMDRFYEVTAVMDRIKILTRRAEPLPPAVPMRDQSRPR